jgi:TolB-like protein/tetratricopeptide (TPR) repeat protein
MESWIIDNANLLSGLAGIVTVLSILLPPILRRNTTARELPSGHTPLPPLAATSVASARIPSLAAPGDGPGAIAVLPFDSISQHAGDAHLADGISCEIISALSRAGYQHIAPRADCFALRGKGLSLAETATRLSVRYIVHGSVRNDGDRLRVIAEFADSASGRQLWSKTYERPLTDILKVQAEIAQAIASSLGGEAFRAEVLHLSPGTSDTTAWGLAQKARHDYMLATDATGISVAIESTRKAVAIDPRYALAHALLAQLLSDQASTASVTDLEAVRQEARAALEQALALARRDPEVLMYAGRVWMELGERDKSVTALRLGTQLSPYDLMEWGFLARALAFGSVDNAREAHDIAARIIEIAPEHPCVWTWELFQGVACLNLERYAEAVELFRRVVEASPKFVRGIMCLANALGACDKHDEAAACVAHALAVNANFTAQRYAGYVRVLSGNDEAARRLLFGLIKAGLIAA